MYSGMKQHSFTGINAHIVMGATLIEVMVALVIMSIGLLGLASLQLTGISNNSSSEKRTQAAIVTNDLVERMRANLNSVTAGDYAAVLNNNPNIDCTAPPPTYCEDHGSAATICTSAQMAGFDAYTAWCNANALLQSGTITVSCTDSAGAAQACGATPYRTITVGWVNQTDNGPAPKTLITTIRP
jgi:type IV pilus modification protein PilV